MATTKLKDFVLRVTTEADIIYAQEICEQLEKSAKDRGVGIAKRDVSYLTEKIRDGKAIIALNKKNEFVGFCYIETWSHEKYVANSGLIVKSEYRQYGLATEIKKQTFDLSRLKYPNAKIFGITTSPVVMKINMDLGYSLVGYDKLTKDEAFWNGCSSCVNYEFLNKMEKKICYCNAMLFDPKKKK